MTLRFKRVIVIMQGDDNVKITLKAARTNAGYTQREAAEKIGVTVDTVGNWERGKSYPDALQIKRIESAYNITYDNLIFLPHNTLKA